MIEQCKKLKNKILLKDKDRSILVEFSVWLIMFLFVFLSYCYRDTISMIQYERNFAELLFKGNIFDFYEHTYQLATEKGYHVATYDFLVYIVMGLWGVPLYLLEQITGWNSMQETILLIYGKSILLVALAISSLYIYRIVFFITGNMKNSIRSIYIFVTSILVFEAIGYMGQSDILGISLILIGLEAYLKKENIRFLISFAIAVTFKQYALFVFIPLLVLINKNILKIILYTLVVLAPTILTNTFFDQTTQSMKEKEGFAYKMFGKLVEQKISLGFSEISILILLLGVFYVLIFLKKVDSNEEFIKYAVFIPLTSMLLLFISFQGSPYWYLYISPFFAIVSMVNIERIRENLLFETVAMAALFGHHLVRFTWCFDIDNTKNMILGMIYANNRTITIARGVEKATDIAPLLMNEIEMILQSIFVVLVIGIIYLNLPSKMGRVSIETERQIRMYTIMRFFVNVVVAYIPIYLLMMN